MYTAICSMNATSLDGAPYYITFIDDHSMKVWAYALKIKHQDLKLFQASIEKETDNKLTCVRSNNGGEYKGSFEDYFKIQGIKFKKIETKTL